ncbi:MAG: hypothetical protein AB1427_01120 [Thermodesulfobacteriota bacterium]
MRVKVFALLAAAVLILSLAACGDQKAAKTEEKAPATAEQSATAQPAQEQAAAPAEVAVSGTVDAAGKITAADGQTYAIADTDMGKEVVKLASKKVELKGTVAENQGVKTITVIEFKEVK